MIHQGEILRKIIKESKFTQVQIAEKLGLNKNHLNATLNKQTIKEDITRRICEILEVNSDDVFSPANYDIQIRYNELKERFLFEKEHLLNQIQELIKENRDLRKENKELRNR